MSSYKNQTFLSTLFWENGRAKCQFWSADEFYETAGSGQKRGLMIRTLHIQFLRKRLFCINPDPGNENFVGRNFQKVNFPDRSKTRKTSAWKIIFWEDLETAFHPESDR